MLRILATFISFGLFFATWLKCGLFLCQNSDFGIFWNFLATFGAQSGSSAYGPNAGIEKAARDGGIKEAPLGVSRHAKRSNNKVYVDGKSNVLRLVL